MSTSKPGSDVSFTDIALPMIRRGVCVVPTYPGLRHPALEKWQDIASCSEAQIREWGSNGYAHANCISVSKRGKTWSLDVDDIVAAKAAGMPESGKTLRVRTPRGGAHLYFSHSPESEALPSYLAVKDAQGNKIVEAKLHNAAVASPGSVRDDGGVYLVASDNPIAPASPELLKWLLGNASTKQHDPGVRPRKLHPDFDANDLFNHYEWELADQFTKDGADYFVFGSCPIKGEPHTDGVRSKKTCLIVGKTVGFRCMVCDEYDYKGLIQHMVEQGYEEYPHYVYADEDDTILLEGTGKAPMLAEEPKAQAKNSFPPEEGEITYHTGMDGTEEFILTAIPANSVKPEQITWLWPERIPLGKMTLFAGKPDCGKSTAMIDVVARVTTGRDWPDGSKNSLGPRDVLMAVAEDDLSDTVVPRLMAADADLNRIHFLNRVRITDIAAEEPTAPEIRQLQLAADVAKLRKAIGARPEVALVVVDTITSYFGDVNTNADKDVRPVMDALSRVFRDCGACFLAIVHHNKRNDVDAVQKILGAASVAGAVRAAWGFSRDPGNKEEFYMARVKNNLSKKLGGMKYKISETNIGDIVAPHVEWLGEVDETANEVMDKEREAATGRRENRKIDMARLFLKSALAQGPRKQSEIESEAENEGVNIWTLRNAKRELEVVSDKRGRDWWWSLLPVEPAPPEPQDVI